MMKYLLLLLLIGCADIEPVVDLKSSSTPGEYYTDWQECDWLMEKFDLSDPALEKCLNGRGYSIIGIKGR